MHLPALTALLLPALALALPTTTPQTTGRNFTLASRSSNPAYNALHLSSYHIEPAFDYAVLVPATEAGAVAYFAGSGAERETRFYAGDGSFSYGFVLDAVNATYHPVEIKAGDGTAGARVEKDDLVFAGSTFFACNTTLLYGPAVQVFFSTGEVLAEGCAAVELKVDFVD